MEIGELFEKSFYLTVNPARAKVFEARMKAAGLPVPRRFNGFTPNNRCQDKIACIGFSHGSLIRLAEALGWDYVAIFEDDCYPEKDILADLPVYTSDLPEDISMLRLGWTVRRDNPVQAAPKYLKCSTFGAHSYIVFKAGYQLYRQMSVKDVNADDYVFKMPGSYTTAKNLFIQLNEGKDDTVHSYKNLSWNKAKANGFQF